MTPNNSKYIIDDYNVLTVLLCALTIPLSMSLWIINIIYSKFVTGHEGLDEPVVISPTRWLASCLIPLLVAVHGYRKKSVALSGAVLGCFVAFILTLSNYSFLVCLITFFLSSSKATKVRGNLKKKLEVDFKEGGQRTWVQVLCNGGMATQLALLYLLDVGASERPIDFVQDYRASWLTVGVLAVFASCNGDTWASELGTVFSYSKPYLVTNFKKVPKGTNGGISIEGTVFSALGGLAVGLAQYLTIYYFSESSLWYYAPPQWPIIILGGFSGFLGSLIDSVLGATLQYSGLNKEGQIVTHSSLAVKHISGRNILDNNSVNLISTVIMGLLIPTLCKNIWPLF
ncbi:unnamed protein product [Arctia plantaginis]|uniref:Transmembrane protein 19 n=1 Tax=Arctia plantaginis TaxID=874455 RepID=A0A8S1BQC4_ARCPL|nr:unnamed protein product [Arctia plantaginis]